MSHFSGCLTSVVLNSDSRDDCCSWTSGRLGLSLARLDSVPLGAICLTGRCGIP